MGRHKNNQNATGNYKHSSLLKSIAWSKPIEIKQVLRTSSRGLIEKEALLRLKLTGRNELASEKVTWGKQLATSVNNRFNFLVIALAGVSYLTHDAQGAAVMASMVVLSIALTFFQEFRSTQAAEKLKELVNTRVTVTRIDDDLGAHAAGVRRDIDLAEVVPGDLVILSAGDIIPGDLMLFAA